MHQNNSNNINDTNEIANTVHNQITFYQIKIMLILALILITKVELIMERVLKNFKIAIKVIMQKDGCWVLLTYLIYSKLSLL